MHETAVTQRFTGIIERDDDIYVALCPELDIARQGETVSDSRNNLREAIEHSWSLPRRTRYKVASLTKSISPRLRSPLLYSQNR